MTLEEFKPHPKQLIALTSPRRFIACIAGLQGGKTLVGAAWLLNEIYKDYEAGHKYDYLIVAPRYKTIEQATLPKFLELMPPDWGVFKKQAMVVELAWGSKIYIRSADNPNSIESMTIRAIWADEAGDTTAEIWSKLLGRVSILQGRIFMTSTPYANNWLYRDVYKKCGWKNGEPQPDGDTNIEVVEWISTDNPAFSSAELEIHKQKLDPLIFEQRYMGKFVTLEGLVYPVSEDCIIAPIAIPAEWRHIGGMDFGKADPTVILDIVEDPVQHTFYLIDEYYRSNGLLKDMAEWIGSHPLSRVLADPQSAQLITELRQAYGLGVVQPADKQEIKVGIERITALLKEGRLKIFSTCKNTIEEFSTYHYPRPDEDKVTKDKPVDKNNHAMDALRYAFNKPVETGFYKKQEDVKQKKQRYTPMVTRTQWAHGLNVITGY